LIIGAGGTCETTIFVNELLGLKSIVYNRSADRLNSLKERYPSILRCVDYNTLQISAEDGQKIEYSDLAMIVSVIPEKNDFSFKDELFQYDPVIFDVTYKSKTTNILDAVIFRDD
jgi:shikimate 5-dehydrogenase